MHHVNAESLPKEKGVKNEEKERGRKEEDKKRKKRERPKNKNPKGKPHPIPKTTNRNNLTPTKHRRGEKGKTNRLRPG